MKIQNSANLATEPWTSQEESAIVKKIDRKVLLFLAVMFFFAFLARVNMGNAKIANLETQHTLLHSLNINTTQFLFGIMLFFIPYVNLKKDLILLF